MNFEVFILGTGGMMPLPGRFLTSVLVRREGELLLFDCGEGTQVSLKKLNLKWKKIDSIFISHMHADHVTGLPGMLMLSSQVDRTEPLTIYGPTRIKEYIDENRRILDMFINYEIQVVVVDGPGRILERPDYHVDAFQLNHTKTCYGYSIVEHDRAGVFFPEKAEACHVPKGVLWSRLQKGYDVELEDGTIIHPEQVMGESRSGRKFSFVTDTMNLPTISKHVADSDLFICEGMFDDALESSAREKKHLTARQAGIIASEAGGVGRMGLIHYSPRYHDRELRQLLKEAREEFDQTFLCRDNQILEITYKD